MAIFDVARAPFPWLGGKSLAAPIVWRALGDVHHYVEPFAGSLAVLLKRPHPLHRPNYSETVNDKDGLVVNFWRAVQYDPQTVARYASWPVTALDKISREIAVLEWIASGAADRLAGSYDYYDARIAGWWAWGMSITIGMRFAAGGGSWFRDPRTGKITKIKRAQRSGALRGGATRERPHASTNGQGVNHPGAREPGLERDARHPAHDADNGDWSEHVARDYAESDGYHPIVMPELRRWFAWLCARLRHVRVLNGDWAHAVKPSVLFTMPIRTGPGVAGVFLDPPYSHAERDSTLYRVDEDVAADVREWCLRNSDNPQLRIVLAGFDTEHAELERHGWRAVEWFSEGLFTGGMAQYGSRGTQQHRERLWLSPHCLRDFEQATLFDEDV